MSIPPVRPQTSDDRSNAIILSIDSKWFSVLQSGSLQWVIRKRLPFSSAPKFVYFHAKSPRSAIIGRAKIRAIRRAPLDFLLENHSKLQMEAKEIKEYIGDTAEAGLLQFEMMEPSTGHANLARLRQNLSYFPPQSFAFISRTALPIIDEMCGF